MTAAEKVRRYKRKLDTLVSQAARQDAAVLARIRKAWRRWRARVLGHAADGYDLTQASIVSLERVVARELDVLAASLVGDLKAGMVHREEMATEISRTFGELFLVEFSPLPETGASLELVDIASRYSADLIGLNSGGLAARVLRQVNTELQLAVLGQFAPGPWGAMGALGKALEGVRGWIYETERIYRTEVNRVYSLRMEAEIRDLARFGRVMKRWRWSGIARQEHARIDGQTVPASARFRVPRRPSRKDPRPFVFMRFPRDPTAPADATINCGCYHYPVPGDRKLRRLFGPSG